MQPARKERWIPAFAGMTENTAGMKDHGAGMTSENFVIPAKAGIHPLSILDLGLRDYGEVLMRMRRMAQERAEDQIEDTMLIVRHPAVYTMGRGLERSVREQALETGTLRTDRCLQAASLPHPLYEVERGGGITAHGPGQLVLYPIVKLTPETGFGLRAYLTWFLEFGRQLVEAIASPLKTEANTLSTGIWLEGHKVASVGVAVKREVTLHGMAINLSMDLSIFQAIHPCGLMPEQMGNLNAILGRPIDERDVLQHVNHLLSCGVPKGAKS